MDSQTIYQDTMIQIQTNFREEAASHLEEGQIKQILEEEQDRIQFAQQHQVPIRSWIGSNTRRYCKDLLRRKQPLFPLYCLLGICTEASIVLFFCYLIRALFSPLHTIPFTGVPGAVIALYACLEANKSYTRRALGRHNVPKTGHRILLAVFTALVVSAVSLLFWQRLAPLYRQLSLYHTFLLYVGFLFLSGIHNVVYSSHIIPFFTVGILRIGRRPPEEIQQAGRRYLNYRSAALLAARNQTPEQMAADPGLYTEIHMEIRSHLITSRIYLCLAVFILAVLDILCIYQYIQIGTVTLLIFGILAVMWCTVLLSVCIISCNELLHQVSQ